MADMDVQEAPTDVNTSPAPDLKLDRVQVKLKSQDNKFNVSLVLSHRKKMKVTLVHHHRLVQ